MTSIYLYINAALYLVFAAWCTLSLVTTSRNLGYETLTANGRSEYLVIYGGLQLGLAITFWMLASNSSLHRFGLLFSPAVYGPIVLYRWITIVMFKAGGMTSGIACLETVLLLAAVGLLVYQAD